MTDAVQATTLDSLGTDADGNPVRFAIVKLSGKEGSFRALREGEEVIFAGRYRVESVKFQRDKLHKLFREHALKLIGAIEIGPGDDLYDELDERLPVGDEEVQVVEIPGQLSIDDAERAAADAGGDVVVQLPSPLAERDAAVEAIVGRFADDEEAGDDAEVVELPDLPRGDHRPDDDDWEDPQ